MTQPPPDIDGTTRAAILRRLAALEAAHDMRVLYACESGSRGWGFASPDSDYDVRFLYVHPPAWYLQVSAQRDVIEPGIDGELDIAGWELRKALGLLKKGNTTLMEWLDSPIVYRAEAPFVAALRRAATQVWRPAHGFRHYLHMARRQQREHLLGASVRLKKVLYVLRPLLAACWIESGRGPAPMALQTLLDALPLDADLRAAIAELLALKRAAAESGLTAPLPLLHRFIDTELARLEAAPAPAATSVDFGTLDRLLFDTVLARPATATPPAAAGSA